ncbi:MAG TPA: carboxypeptidase-like regulatory domain-containing protein [Vicinamibacterales bacterium]
MLVRPPNTTGLPRTPYGVLTGRVMSAAGTPLPRLSVEATSTTHPGTRFGATTGPDGHYRVEVRPGSYTVKSSEGVVAPPEFRNASTYELHGAAESAPVVVNARTQVEVDLWLPTTAILYNATITVLDDEGQPAKDAEVEFFWNRDPLTPNGTGANSIGVFHTNGKPVVLGPTLPGLITVVARTLSGAVPLAGITQFDLQGASRKVRVLMRAAARVSGRVEFDGREIPVQGGNGTRILFVPVGSMLHYSSETPTIEPDGAFTLNGLIGEGCLRVDGLPYGWRLKEISQNGEDLTNRLFTLEPGDVKSDVVIRVEVGDPPKWRIPPCT